MAQKMAYSCASALLFLLGGCASSSDGTPFVTTGANSAPLPSMIEEEEGTEAPLNGGTKPEGGETTREDTLEEGGETGPEEDGEVTPEESGETTPEEGGEATAEEGGEAAPEEGGEKPNEEGGEKPAQEGGEKPVEEGGEKPVEEGGEKPNEEGGEKPAEEGGEKPAEEGGEKPTQEGGSEGATMFTSCSELIDCLDFCDDENDALSPCEQGCFDKSSATAINDTLAFLQCSGEADEVCEEEDIECFEDVCGELLSVCLELGWSGEGDGFCAEIVFLDPEPDEDELEIYPAPENASACPGSIATLTLLDQYLNSEPSPCDEPTLESLSDSCTVAFECGEFGDIVYGGIEQLFLSDGSLETSVTLKIEVGQGSGNFTIVECEYLITSPWD